MFVTGQKLDKIRMTTRPSLHEDHLLGIIRTLVPVLLDVCIQLLGPSRAVRIRGRFGAGAIGTIDPVQDRGEDLSQKG